MAVIQPRPTYILYECAKCGDDRTSFSVICDVCDVQHVSQKLDRQCPSNIFHGNLLGSRIN